MNYNTVCPVQILRERGCIFCAPGEPWAASIYSRSAIGYKREFFQRMGVFTVFLILGAAVQLNHAIRPGYVADRLL